LYNIDLDPEEAEDVSLDHPDIVAAIQQQVAQMLRTLPSAAQSAWKTTQNTPVYPNTPGAYPSPIVP
jgi:hypothetical protein